MYDARLLPDLTTFNLRKPIMMLLLLLVTAGSVVAQTGRLEGTVVDETSGEPLIGVNIYIEELEIGAATDLDGYFSVVNVRAGTYTVRASYIGYSTIRITDVRVNINQTTTLDFAMSEEVFAGSEVVVVADRPVIQRDVGASRVNLDAEEVRNLPVQSVGQIVGLQAGIQGLAIRGGSTQEVSFNLNGLSLRDERSNTPFTAVSITSISEIQVQSGGFSAEYGDVQSGMINVVTKEGSRDRFNFDIFYSHNPPTSKHFGPAPNDPNSYWIRPYVDSEVAFTGTEAWDPWTRAQYPRFDGWNSIAEASLSNPDPTRHLTPLAAQQIFLWQHRKDMAINDPDFTLDFGFGGPVPVISESAGNLRFWASHRRSQSMYVIPLSSDRYETYTTNFKLTSDIAQGMKLSIDAMMGGESGTSSNNVGAPGIFTSAAGIASSVSTSTSFGDSRMFASDYWAPTQVDYRLIGGKFTHVLNSDSYYEVTANYFSSAYDTNPGSLRDTSAVRTFGNGFPVDEAPFGFWPLPANGIGSSLRMGVGMSNARDSSQVAYTNVRFDYTNQYNRYNQLKTGFQLVQTFSDVNYGSVDEVLLSGRTTTVWDNNPIRGAIYAQNKFEYEGIVAEVGLRVDYSNANAQWIVYDVFDERFATALPGELEEFFDTESTDPQFTISPRLAVSFPITVSSKLFFNYGHFRSMPSPDNLYRVERLIENNSINRVANPNLALPQTVSYELGFEQALSEQYLLRMAGYYKDESNLPSNVAYRDQTGGLLYNTSSADGYRDIRGFEITVRKAQGRYFQGFVNYTYMIRSTGRFGFTNVYLNQKDQREFERQQAINPQVKPLAQPYARANLDFFTPVDFGPSMGAFRPLADWRASLLASWQSGFYLTWAGGGSIPGIANNLQWRDYYNFDLRFSRTFRPFDLSMNFFVDINNVLNTRRLSTAGFMDGEDSNNYYRSLHLPADKLEPLRGSYNTVPGSDRPGDFRKPGVEFQPIVAVNQLTDVNSPHVRPLYYNYADEAYYRWNAETGQFVTADPDFVRQVLDDKAYIDMPNFESFHFFNPRNVIFGVRISF